MATPRITDKRELSVKFNHKDDDTASDGGRPRKRQRKAETPPKQIQPEPNTSSSHSTRRKSTTVEKAAPPRHADHGVLGEAQFQPNRAEESIRRTVNSTSTEPKIDITSMRYINSEPVDDTVAVLLTMGARDQDGALDGEQHGNSSPNKVSLDASIEKPTASKDVQQQPYATECTAPTVQSRPGRFLSDTAYPGVFEPDVILIFQSMITYRPASQRSSSFVVKLVANDGP